MLGQLINRFGTTLYIQLWESKVRITDFSTGMLFEDEPWLVINKKTKAISGIGRAALAVMNPQEEAINPFSHPRVLFADFPSGQMLVALAIKKVLPRALFMPAPFVIIHPMEKTEGGLTIIERRAFQELGVSVGARETRVYEGKVLVATHFDLNAFKAGNPRD